MSDDHVPNPLVKNLAAVTQVRLPGTAGRIAQQIRDLEGIAPLFQKAGLVRKVHRPTPLTVHAAGISTHTPSPIRFMGGFLYAAGAVRFDLIAKDNQVSSGTQDSICEMDDIDYEDQRLRLQLVSIAQAYRLADATMRDSEQRDMVIMDCPLLVSRSLIAPKDDVAHEGHRHAYADAVAAVESFWAAHRDQLRPWNPEGTTLVSVSGGRFGAVLQLAQRDLRTTDGRSFILPGEGVELGKLGEIDNVTKTILNIGERRFMHGLLGPFTRTGAFRLDFSSPSMEPSTLAKEGVIGFHFKGSEGTAVRFAHIVGPPDTWTSKMVDSIAGILMAMSTIGGQRAEPLPLLLARRELKKPLEQSLELYSREVRRYLKSRINEAAWLSDLDALD
jgi:hypothetical protein